MGQPRLRLVNKEPVQNGQTASEHSTTETPSPTRQRSSTSRPKRTRKSDAHSGSLPSSTVSEENPMKENCLRLYKAVKEMEKDGEPLCLAFNKLPSRKEYPDYYVEIERPIALDIIKTKITKAIYKSVTNFISDIDLMCDNAQIYNMPGSYIYEAAGDIKSKVHSLAAEIKNKEPESRTEPTKPNPPTPHLKLTIRNVDRENPDASATGSESQHSQTAKLKRKRSVGDQIEGQAVSVPDSEVTAMRAVEASVDMNIDNSSDSKSVIGKQTRIHRKSRRQINDESGTEGGNNSEIETPKENTDPKSKSGAGKGNMLDLLFKAIYDAELGAALKLLEEPDLPINDFRKMILQEPVEGVSNTEEFEWAPIHAAAYYGRLKVAQVLCSKGANVEAVDTMHNSTPLAWAAYTGRKRLAKWLVRVAHANVNVRNVHNQLPIEIVLDPDNTKWTEFLMPTDGSKVNMPAIAAASAAAAAVGSESPRSGSEAHRTPSRKAKSRTEEIKRQKIPGSQSGSASPAPNLAHTISSMREGSANSQLDRNVIAMAASAVVQTPDQKTASQQHQQQVAQRLSQHAVGGISPIPQCIGGIGNQEVVHPKMNDAMREIIQAIEYYKDEDGDQLHEAFDELPDRAEYPEYYEVITHPMALGIVKKRITSGYRSFDAFNFDMLWIFNNATFFNEPDSQIYEDAVELDSFYRQKRKEVLKKYEIPFDTSYDDTDPEEGRYVNRLTAGELDLYVGDFIYIKGQTGVRIAMITHLRVAGPQDRRKYIDGYWFFTPSEVPEIQGQPVYPHQIFAGPSFIGHGVRGVVRKCYVLQFNVYVRVFPQGFNAQDLYICESRYIPDSGTGKPGSFKPIVNWALDFKTPLMKPPAFIQYIIPLSPKKQPVEMWNNTNLLPHIGLTILNQEAATRAQLQAQSAQSTGSQMIQAKTPYTQTQTQAQMLTPGQVPIQPTMQPLTPGQAQSLPPTQGQIAGSPVIPIRPVSQTQNTAQAIQQALQGLTIRHNQNLNNAHMQHSQRDNSIRQQAMNKIALSQQQNPGFIGSPHHQALLQQQSQMLQQSQQSYFAFVQQLQQSYNQQTQALKQQLQQVQRLQQQQQQQQISFVSSPIVSNLTPLSSQPFMSTQNSMVPTHSSPSILPTSVGGMHIGTQALISRPMQMQMSIPMNSQIQQTQINTTGTGLSMSPTVSMGLPGSPATNQPLGVRPLGIPSSGVMQTSGFSGPTQTYVQQQQQLQQELLKLKDDSIAATQQMTPTKPPAGTQGPVRTLTSIPPGTNAQAMMAMLLQHQQQQHQLAQQQNQQLNQQRPNTTQSGAPKPTATPLSPDMSSQAGSQLSHTNQNSINAQGPGEVGANSSSAFDLWKKTTRVFVTHGNVKITGGLAIQVATPDSSMFMHISLNDIEANHALQVSRATGSILLRPIPGPLNSNGKTVLTLTINGRRLLPRMIPDNTAPVSSADNNDHTNHSVKEKAENGIVEDREDTQMTLLSNDESKNEKENNETTLLVKSSSYVYELPLHDGTNIIDLEASALDWNSESVGDQYQDQQVPPANTTDVTKSQMQIKHYMVFITRS